MTGFFVIQGFFNVKIISRLNPKCGNIFFIRWVYGMRGFYLIDSYSTLILAERAILINNPLLLILAMSFSLLNGMPVTIYPNFLSEWRHSPKEGYQKICKKNPFLFFAWWPSFSENSWPVSQVSSWMTSQRSGQSGFSLLHQALKNGRCGVPASAPVTDQALLWHSCQCLPLT